MEYYKTSKNLKYACLRSKLQSIKTHPNTVILHKHKAQGKALSTPVSAWRASQKTACSPVPRISSPSWYFQLWSSTHIQWSKVDRYISGRNSIRSNSNSFLPPIVIICKRHSLSKLIIITQLTQLTKLTLITQLIQLTVTHSIHPNHSTHQTH